MIDAVKLLLHAQIAAMRTACTIDPGFFIRPYRLHDKRVIIHPLSYRISEPPRFGIIGEFPAIGPNEPPDLVELVQEDHALGRLKDLSRS